MNCYRVKFLGENDSELVVSDSIINAIEKACEKHDSKQYEIFEVINLGDIIT